MSLLEELQNTIRDVQDFPKPGILFKDITPVLSDPSLTIRISKALRDYWSDHKVDGVAGIESRGFIFGMQLAQMLDVPFIPIRKAGKLPFQTVKYAYELEYGTAEMEMHIDAISPGHKVLVHDDLLATGGTAAAAAELIKKCDGEIAGFSFLIALGFLKGDDILTPHSERIHSLVNY